MGRGGVGRRGWLGGVIVVGVGVAFLLDLVLDFLGLGMWAPVGVSVVGAGLSVALVFILAGGGWEKMFWSRVEGGRCVEVCWLDWLGLSSVVVGGDCGGE